PFDVETSMADAIAEYRAGLERACRSPENAAASRPPYAGIDTAAFSREKQRSGRGRLRRQGATEAISGAAGPSPRLLGIRSRRSVSPPPTSVTRRSRHQSWDRADRRVSASAAVAPAVVGW